MSTPGRTTNSSSPTIEAGVAAHGGRRHRVAVSAGLDELQGFRNSAQTIASGSGDDVDFSRYEGPVNE
jgi:hypothetical protein